MKQKFNVDITHVPYRGAAQALQDILGGNIDMRVRHELADVADPAEREARLRATELHYYLRPLLGAPTAERAVRLAGAPCA